jgi:hypothetical protein
MIHNNMFKNSPVIRNNFQIRMKQISICLILVVLYYSSVLAQISGVTPKSISLGMTGTVYSNGLNAISINPANLAIVDDINLSFTLIPNISVNFENNMFDLSTYNKYFTGIDDGKGGRSPKYLSDQDKSDILNLFPSSGRGEVYTSPEVTLFSIAYHSKKILGGIALSVKERTFGNVSLPKEALKLLLYGNSLNSSYNFNQTALYASWIREFSLSYGGQIYSDKDKTIGIGVNFKYLLGNAFFEVNKFNSNFVTTDSSIKGRFNLHAFSSMSDFLKDKGDFSFFGNPAGSGFAADIGFSLSFSSALSFGISLTDLGSIKWNKNNEVIDVDTVSEIIDLTESDQFDPFKNIIDRHKTINAASRTIQMPLGFHIGAQLELNNLEYFKKRNLFPILFTSDFHYILNPNLDNKIFYLYSLGMEARLISWLPIRTGVSIGTLPFALSFGFGINTKHFDLDIGTGNFLALFDAKQTKQASVAFGTLFKF